MALPETIVVKIILMNTAICRETLFNLYGEMNEDVAVFFTEFIVAYPEFRENCTIAFLNKNPEQLGSLLHQYGPSFTYVGFPQVTTAMKQLEDTCKTVQVFTEIELPYNRLIEMADAAFVEIKKELVLMQPGSTII
jgi:hypothetical protein